MSSLSSSSSSPSSPILHHRNRFRYLLRFPRFSKFLRIFSRLRLSNGRRTIHVFFTPSVTQDDLNVILHLFNEILDKLESIREHIVSSRKDMVSFREKLVSSREDMAAIRSDRAETRTTMHTLSAKDELRDLIAEMYRL
ncbi:hypothetical protein BDV97DRAFT_362342 [Delphinella strobiligena]|nr:hypothetical protein BDV97DRAFT_362342 [Delphinella strobiligena]